MMSHWPSQLSWWVHVHSPWLCLAFYMSGGRTRQARERVFLELNIKLLYQLNLFQIFKSLHWRSAGQHFDCCKVVWDMVHGVRQICSIMHPPSSCIFEGFPAPRGRQAWKNEWIWYRVWLTISIIKIICHIGLKLSRKLKIAFFKDMSNVTSKLKVR